MVERPAIQTEHNDNRQNREPLLPQYFFKLPVGAIKPKGWLEKNLILQKEGLSGQLGEISAWLDKENNAWLDTGTDYGWEEVPYWLKGYGNMAYILDDKEMIKETKRWLEAAFESQRDDGYFGPYIERNGRPDLMIMIWCMQSYYEYLGDSRVIKLMTDYFKWQLELPDKLFLKDYWENSRGGDNLLSVCWLFNITGEPFLLELAEKTHRNTANWRQRSTLPNWHNVNIAQCFREPASYYLLSKDSADLLATYNVHHLIRNTFGQVPGGMFGADENARMGYIDPRQGTETCGFVEQMASDEILLRITGDPFWAEHCETVAFNSYPASLMPDLKALRYITSPNHTISDSENHHPGIDNQGPFLSMNPFSSRCCQHNHGQGWPYLIEHLIMSTADDGIAAAIYGACTAEVDMGGGKKVTITEETEYPFEERIRFTVNPQSALRFPLYLRIPSWAHNPELEINGESVDVKAVPGKYLRIERVWQPDDRVVLNVPMKLSQSIWQTNQNSRSIDYGPLTFSLRIEENYKRVNSTETAIGDSKWQKDVDPAKWPTYPDYSFKHYNINSGLSQNTIFSILQDRQGFMWFGTKDGLNRFDGSSFKTFRFLPDDVLRDNSFKRIVQDKDDNLWVATDEGVYIYNPRQDSFSRFEKWTGKQEKMEGTVSDMIMDHDGDIWISVEGQGIFQYDTARDQLVFYNIPIAGGGLKILTLCAGKNGEMWVFPYSRPLIRIDKHTGQINDFNLRDDPSLLFNTGEVSSVIADRYNELILATSQQGLLSINTVNATHKVLLAEDQYGEPIFARSLGSVNK